MNGPCPDDVVEEVDTQNRVVRNYLKMPSLHRKDHDDVLSCVASNTNLTARPQITYININMVCKYLFYTTWSINITHNVYMFHHFEM